MKAVHLNNALDPRAFVIPICGDRSPDRVGTTDRNMVTCRRCLAILIRATGATKRQAEQVSP
jgi:hypothetical protein